MSFVPFSKKQLEVLNWWTPSNPFSKCDGIICDGAVRSGKTLCMSVSFVSWAMFYFKNTSFAICGKTIKSVKRNVAVPLLDALRDIGFDVNEKISSNLSDILKSKYFIWMLNTMFSILCMRAENSLVKNILLLNACGS